MKHLVIVESPAKAKTINKFLGKDFVVKSSVGHVRDLPEGRLGIDIERGFIPEYGVMKGKEQVLKDLKAAAKKVGSIYLCPDPDREGEAIAWHIAEEIGGKGRKIYRVKFNEITKSAVLQAMEHPGEINMDLVDAQQARRILDRLVGYNLSPLLWKKVRRGLSAGRVQSVAVRMIVDREREIQAFVPEEYWSVTGRFEGAVPPSFEAKLAAFQGKKLSLASREAVDLALGEIRSAGVFRLARIDRKERKRNPAAPFTTSKLQMESARKLGFGAKKTMTIAQQLYEGVELGSEGSVGLITYMRTDSVKVSAEAQQEARGFIKERYGEAYLPPKPPVYASKKGAQEAHEAVRPSSVTRDPDSLKDFLSKDQLRLYTLIWNRFLASQMSPARLDQTTFHIEVGAYTFRATGTVVRFPGFMSVYIEGQDDTEEEEKEAQLPPLEEGTTLSLLALEEKQHFTQPPPRYSEATIVKDLEEKGIGRPSTYASIISTIQDRKYVEKREGRFHPTDLGIVVNDFLVEHFGKIVDYNFTAKMEEELDEIEDGRMKWGAVVQDFYDPFSQTLSKVTDIQRVSDKPTDIVCDACGKPMVERLGRRGWFIACTGYPACKNTKPREGEEPVMKPEETDQVCEKCGKPMVLRTGKYGKFLACSGYPDCRNTKPVDGGGPGARPEPTDEECEKCGKPMMLRTGRFGQFLACSGYPKCKNAKPLPTGVYCPKDGGDMVEKRARGRTFYSCANYPECKFSVWGRPVPEPCPKCGAAFLLEKKVQHRLVALECHNKTCGYKRDLTGGEEAESGTPEAD